MYHSDNTLYFSLRGRVVPAGASEIGMHHQLSHGHLVRMALQLPKWPFSGQPSRRGLRNVEDTTGYKGTDETWISLRRIVAATGLREGRLSSPLQSAAFRVSVT